MVRKAKATAPTLARPDPVNDPTHASLLARWYDWSLWKDRDACGHGRRERALQVISGLRAEFAAAGVACPPECYPGSTDEECRFPPYALAVWRLCFELACARWRHTAWLDNPERDSKAS